MRSRTELVTTTFIDSEDDFTETDDSEEDWRPSASNRNGKKRPPTATKGKNRLSRKRKTSGASSSGAHKTPRRQAALDANYQLFDDSDDEYEYDYQYYKARTQLASEVEPKAMILPPKKKERNSGIIQLYVYRKDLLEDYVTNPHLCLWRKDGTTLLQKYIRVKTGVPEEFIFTSSSVYSTWDEKRRRDFANITVKFLEENNRRVTLMNPDDIHQLAKVERDKVASAENENEDNTERGELDDGDEEHPGDSDVDVDDYGSDQNSGGTDYEDNDDSFQPEDEDADGEGEEEHLDEVEEDELGFEDDRHERSLEIQRQLREVDDDDYDGGEEEEDEEAEVDVGEAEKYQDEEDDADADDLPDPNIEYDHRSESETEKN